MDHIQGKVVSPTELELAYTGIKWEIKLRTFSGKQ